VAWASLPRVVVAGLSGDAGKTLVCLGLVRAMRARGLRVAAYKKGPDFIDAAWLGVAAGSPGRNLDTFLMPRDSIERSVARAASIADIAIVEGNRGLFDGVDARGTHSTAELAKAIGAPVILVVDATKVTATVAALVLGCRALDPALQLAGVVLNRVATPRHERVIREALANIGVAVLGAVPRIDDIQLPSRHLGLVTVAEHPAAERVVAALGELVGSSVDIDALRAVAASAPAVECGEQSPVLPPAAPRVRVGVFADTAFMFYYPENLEALVAAGAELVSVSPLADADLPAVDLLYAGGGFPEVYAAELSRNRAFRDQVAARVADGLPVWAECGGLMYLARSLSANGVTQPMVGALPLTISFTDRPKGHGYVVARVDGPNAFVPEESILRGHEFHYSRVEEGGDRVRTVLALERGVGVGGGRDGVVEKGVLASYTHFHALGMPGWAPALVAAARRGAWCAA
jgi:cobyrinic acid a,c-diamide synthase